MEKIKTLFKAFWVLLDHQELGPSERVILPVKYLLTFGLFTLIIFLLGNYFWSEQVFIYIWMFCLTCWAFLHVKKSITTWDRFDEIDQRDTDFAEEIDKRLERLYKEIEQLKKEQHKAGSNKKKKVAKTTKKKATKKKTSRARKV